MNCPIPCWGQGGRRATAGAGRQGVISAPEIPSPTKLQAGSQLLTKSSWDPGRLTSTRRVAARNQLPRGDTWHTWDGARAVNPGNWAAGTREAMRHTPPSRETALTKHLVAWAARTWEWDKTQAQPSLCLCGVPENLNLSGLDLGSAHNPGPALDSSPAEQAGAWAVQTGKAHTPWVGANPGWPRSCEHSPHTPVIFVCSAPPPQKHGWTSEPK